MLTTYIHHENHQQRCVSLQHRNHTLLNVYTKGVCVFECDNKTYPWRIRYESISTAFSFVKRVRGKRQLRFVPKRYLTKTLWNVNTNPNRIPTVTLKASRTRNVLNVCTLVHYYFDYLLNFVFFFFHRVTALTPLRRRGRCVLVRWTNAE